MLMIINIIVEKLYWYSSNCLECHSITSAAVRLHQISTDRRRSHWQLSHGVRGCSVPLEMSIFRHNSVVKNCERWSDLKRRQPKLQLVYGIESRWEGGERREKEVEDWGGRKEREEGGKSIGRNGGPSYNFVIPYTTLVRSLFFFWFQGPSLWLKYIPKYTIIWL